MILFKHYTVLLLVFVLVKGHYRTGNAVLYDELKAQVWVQRFPNLPTPRSSAAAFICGDYLVVVGGGGRMKMVTL